MTRVHLGAKPVLLDGEDHDLEEDYQALLDSAPDSEFKQQVNGFLVENLASTFMDSKGKGIEEEAPALRRPHNAQPRVRKSYEKSRFHPETGASGARRLRLTKNINYSKVEKGEVRSTNQSRMM